MMRFAFLLALLTAGAVGAPATGVGGAATQPSPLSLSAAPASDVFAHGQPVIIEVALTNAGTQTALASQRAGGSLFVVSLTRDGQPVPTRLTEYFYLEGLDVLLAASLKPLAPGERLTLRWRSTFDDELGGQALDSVDYDLEGGANLATLYGLGEPGVYALTLVYQYLGPSEAPGVVLEPSNEVTVGFTVAP